MSATSVPVPNTNMCKVRTHTRKQSSVRTGFYCCHFSLPTPTKGPDTERVLDDYFKNNPKSLSRYSVEITAICYTYTNRIKRGKFVLIYYGIFLWIVITIRVLVN